MKLIAQTGPRAGQEFPLAKSVITIGRTAGNDIIIRDPQLSRQHAEIRQRGQEWELVDLDSTNGTYVNGKRITAPQVLRPRDRIVLGETVLVVQGLPEVERPRGEAATTAPRVPVRSAPVARPRRTASSLPIIVAGGAAILVIAAILLVARLRQPQATPTPTAEPTSLITPTPTSTETPTPTATATPTLTLTSTLTPTSTPTTSPTPVLLELQWRTPQYGDYDRETFPAAIEITATKVVTITVSITNHTTETLGSDVVPAFYVTTDGEDLHQVTTWKPSETKEIAPGAEGERMYWVFIESDGAWVARAVLEWRERRWEMTFE